MQKDDDMQNINTFGNWINYIVSKGITFQIPDYQRTFAWEKDNVEILLKDLQTNKEYFLGLFLTEAGETAGEYALIDGQQRFTTLYMLFYVLNALHPDKLYFTASEDGDSKKIPLKDFLLYKDIFRLSLQHGQNRDFFQEMLNTPFNREMPHNVQYFSQKKLKKAYDLLYDKLKGLSEQQACQMLQTVSDSSVLLHSASDSGCAMQIFELLNDRGKQLTQLEALKSFIMHRTYILSQQDVRVQNTFRENIKNNFTELYGHLNKINNIAKRDFNEDDILRYYYIAFENWDSKDDYGQTKDRLKAVFNSFQTPREIIDRTQKIIRAFQIMEILITEIHKKNCTYPWLKNLYILNRMASFYPLLMSVYEKFPGILDKVCNYLELYAYRAYPLIERRSDTGVVSLYTLAKKVSLDKNMNENKIFTELKELIERYTGQDWAKERFRIALENPQFCENLNGNDIRYLLIKYENHIQSLAVERKNGFEQSYINNLEQIMAYDKHKNNNYSIEHIIPQSFVNGSNENYDQYVKTATQGGCKEEYAPTDWWKNEKGKRKYTKKLFGDTFLNCLGNLVISQNGPNAAKSNKPPKDKDWSTYLSQQEIKEMIEDNLKRRGKNYWKRDCPFTVDEIIKRKQKLIEFASDYWSENLSDINSRKPLI